MTRCAAARAEHEAAASARPPGALGEDSSTLSPATAGPSYRTRLSSTRSTSWPRSWRSFVWPAGRCTRAGGWSDARPPCRCRSRSTTAPRCSAEHLVQATGIPVLDRGLYFAKVEPQRSYALAFNHPDPLPTDDALGRVADAVDPRRSRAAGGSPSPRRRRGPRRGPYNVGGRARRPAAGVDLPLLPRTPRRRTPGRPRTTPPTTGCPSSGAMPRGGGRIYARDRFREMGHEQRRGGSARRLRRDPRPTAVVDGADVAAGDAPERGPPDRQDQRRRGRVPGHRSGPRRAASAGRCGGRRRGRGSRRPGPHRRARTSTDAHVPWWRCARTSAAS